MPESEEHRDIIDAIDSLYRNKGYHTKKNKSDGMGRRPDLQASNDEHKTTSIEVHKNHLRKDWLIDLRDVKQRTPVDQTRLTYTYVRKWLYIKGYRGRHFDPLLIRRAVLAVRSADVRKAAKWIQSMKAHGLIGNNGELESEIGDF